MLIPKFVLATCIVSQLLVLYLGAADRHILLCFFLTPGASLHGSRIEVLSGPPVNVRFLRTMREDCGVHGFALNLVSSNH